MKVSVPGYLALLLLLSACFIGFVQSQACPYSEPGLINFSSLANYTIAESAIVITSGQKVVIKTSPPVKYSSITVQSGGSLIFHNNYMNINVNHIRVEGNASFIMGSLSCPIYKKITITFYGNRSTESTLGSDPYDGANLGNKGIAFLSGSTVQVVGRLINDMAWTRLRATAYKNTTTITLKEAVNGTWSVGDEIFLTSTDYSEVVDFNSMTDASRGWQRGIAFPDQNEIATIKAISADGLTLTLESPLNYTHFGKDYTFGEVGLITRRIVFKGDDSSENSNFGSHLIVRLVKQFQFIGVEMRNVGQKGLMGRYALHLHLLKDTSKQISTQYMIANNAIWNSYQRCIVIHDSRNILVKNNICFDITGHAFYLEDGSEFGNEFRNNLGARVNPVGDLDELQIIPSDCDASVYWITNPNNTFIGNVAVGGKFGFWLSFPEFPVGLSATIYEGQDFNPRKTSMAPFEDNVAHSSMTGLWIDEMLLPDGTLEVEGYYPRNGSASFFRFTAYKNRDYGAWVKGAVLYLESFLSFDNNVQITGPKGPTITRNSIMIGETSNIGDSSFRPKVDVGGRTRPQMYTSTELIIRGYEVYEDDGPQLLYNCTFINFIPDSYKASGAVSHRSRRQLESAVNKYFGLTFINSNKFYAVNNGLYDNQRMGIWADLDGSISGFPSGGWMVGQDLLNAFSGCVSNSSWNAYGCPASGEMFVQLRVGNNEFDTCNTTSSKGVPQPNLKDPDVITPRMYVVDLLRNITSPTNGSPGKGPTTWVMQYNLLNRGFYALRWPGDHPTPRDLSVSLKNAVNYDWIVLAIQYPNGTDFQVNWAETGSSPTTPMKFASSMAEIIVSPKELVYYNRSTEHLYIKLQNRVGRDDFSNVYPFADYHGNGLVRIVAKCPNNNCAPAKYSNPTSNKLVYNTLMKEDRFVGNLEVCQQKAVNPSLVGSNGSGRVFAFWDSKAKLLDFTVFHNLNLIATEISVGIGAVGSQQRIINPGLNNPISPYGVSRFLIDLSYQEYVSLLKGQMFVKLSTTQNPTGHLRAQLYCSNSTTSTCALPPQIADATNPCVNYGSSALVFADNFSGYTIIQNGDALYSVQPNAYMCGNALIMTMGSGDLYFERSANMNANYTNFEFFVRVLDNYGPINITVTVLGREVVVKKEHVLHYKIDDTITTRVRIPLSEFATNYAFKKMRFRLTEPSSVLRNFVVDSIRFVTNTDSFVSGMTNSEFSYFGKEATCGSTMNPDYDPLTIKSK